MRSTIAAAAAAIVTVLILRAYASHSRTCTYYPDVHTEWCE